ncbi:hypothetical protein GCM10010211_45140 [Streptomyces albospinus]|uniref:Uncharacterized protein n=1 Tax=Streptomyces albospinus TaxID=285515 RepID=A0ABQ2V8W9_9ACTN|nr:hypothetical protein GCM10010211_45140 [Streptomyces albospinus]
MASSLRYGSLRGKLPSGPEVPAAAPGYGAAAGHRKVGTCGYSGMDAADGYRAAAVRSDGAW